MGSKVPLTFCVLKTLISCTQSICDPSSEIISELCEVGHMHIFVFRSLILCTLANYVSVLVTIYWKESLLWWELRDALSMCVINKSLRISVMLCLFSRIKVIVSPLRLPPACLDTSSWTYEVGPQSIQKNHWFICKTFVSLLKLQEHLDSTLSTVAFKIHSWIRFSFSDNTAPFSQ